MVTFFNIVYRYFKLTSQNVADLSHGFREGFWVWVWIWEEFLEKQAKRAKNQPQRSVPTPRQCVILNER
jgi:hypothetical protein